MFPFRPLHPSIISKVYVRHRIMGKWNVIKSDIKYVGSEHSMYHALSHVRQCTAVFVLYVFIDERLLNATLIDDRFPE